MNKTIELDHRQREKLKKVQLELLDAFSYFCDRHDLRYCLFGGTLLGAVRHKGYIPWDDDIDICMPRDDYDKFLSLYQKEGDTRYFVESPETDDKYFYHFAKLMKKGTLYDESNLRDVNARKGIFIDIFPINGVPPKENKIATFHYYFWLFMLNKRSFSPRYHPDKKNKRDLKYVMLSVFSWLLLWWMPYNKAARARDRFMNCHRYENSSLCMIGSSLRSVYDKKCFSGSSYVEFEGRKLKAMEHPEMYLNHKYGDYMELPPRDDMVPHHFLVGFDAGE